MNGGKGMSNNAFHSSTSTIEYTFEELKDIKAAMDESVILAITDTRGTITEVNEKFCEISKYSRKELIGQNHRILNSGFHAKTFFKDMWKTIGKGEIWHGEICNRAKDGSIYWVQTTIVPFLNDKGKPYQYISIRSDITAQKNINIITHYAYHDDLTSLPNRRSLSQQLKKLITQSHQDQSKFAVFFIDINRFRNINDALGHQVGDMFLVEVAERIKTIDKKENTFFRLSGDEFVYLVENPDDLVQTAQKLMGLFKEPFRFNQYEILSSICIGISVFPEHGEDVDTLLASADMAMYAAKKRKGNSFRIYEDHLEGMNDQALILESKLFNAIRKDTLELHYQPKIDIQSEKMVGMEALLRWTDSNLGQIPPSQFIPFAEECGLICDIGEWVLRKVSLQIKEWRKKFDFDLRVSVNISPIHFQESDFIERLKKIITETKVDPQNLEIEITEMTMMDYHDELINKIKEIKGLGITISVDDFGTGYSSLNYLKEFPVDTLKIDRSFIANMAEGKSGIAMVAAIITLAHALNLEVVAEGVETERELEILKRYNCEYVQGYYFSKPLCVEDFTKKMEKQLIGSY